MLSSYKGDKEHWLGARMLLLVFTYLVYAGFRGYNLQFVYSVNGCAIIIFSIAHSFTQPFKSRFVSCIDCLLLVNLCMIYIGIVLFAGSEVIVSRSYRDFFTILMLLAFIVFIVCLVHHFLHLFGCIERFQQMRNTRIEISRIVLPWCMRAMTCKPKYQAIYDIDAQDDSSFKDILKESQC